MGDFLSIATDGWFQTDGLVPNIYEMSTGGTWNEYNEMAEVAPAGEILMDLALMYYLYRRRR